MTHKLMTLFTCLVPLMIGLPTLAARRHGDSPDRDARWSNRAARPVAVSFQLDREAGVAAPKPVDSNSKSPPSSPRSSSTQHSTGGLMSAVFGGRPVGPSGTVGTEILERQDEFGIRTEMLPGPSRDNPWLSTRSRNFVKIPTVASRFVTQASETSIAVFFSAEAYTNDRTKRLFVRAVIDNQPAAPRDIVFTEGDFRGSRSFVFTATVGPGAHIVEMQWLVDDPAVAFMRGASLMVRAAGREHADGTLTVLTPDSGANLTLEQEGWSDIPGVSTMFYMPAGQNLVSVSFSAETHVKSGNIWVRALFNNAEPGLPSDVVLSGEARRDAHMFIFRGPTAVQPGWNSVRMQWNVSAGAIATMGDRSLVVAAFPQASRTEQPVADHNIVVAASGRSDSTSSLDFIPIPGMSATLYVPDDGQVSVAFAAEVSTSSTATMNVRAVINGADLGPSEIAYGQSTTSFGSQSFIFDFKGGSSPGQRTVTLEWRMIGAGSISVGDRTMEVVSESRPIPDLAEATPLGSDANPGFAFRIEPAMGTVPLMAILWDPHRASPDDVTAPVADFQEKLFGSHSLQDYYARLSGGQFGVADAGIFGWYDSKKSGDHYWGHVGCDDPASDGFTGGHQEKWYEALQLADPAFDFSAYDTDGDGTIDKDELAILMVIPQEQTFGSGRELRPFCSDPSAPPVFDGVAVPDIIEWYTSDVSHDYEVAIHEFAHLALDLDDLYSDASTRPGSLSLMDQQEGVSHIDPIYKLALGWLLPRTPTLDGERALSDVRTSHEVIVLPNRGLLPNEEYLLLELRNGDDYLTHYDLPVASPGIAVWHALSGFGAGSPPPNCTVQADWDAQTGGHPARQGIRLIRQTIAPAENSSGLWTSSSYDIDDAGLICPAANDDPAQRRNALIWADGTPSGYALSNFSAPSSSMSVQIEVP